MEIMTDDKSNDTDIDRPDLTSPTKENVRMMIGYLHRKEEIAGADLLFNLWDAYQTLLSTPTEPVPVRLPPPTLPYIAKRLAEHSTHTTPDSQCNWCDHG